MRTIGELFTGERVHKSDRLGDRQAGAAATSSLTTCRPVGRLDPIALRVIAGCQPTTGRRSAGGRAGHW